MPRKMSEEQKEKARQRTREYIERTGGASQKEYRKKVVMIQAILNQERDQDLLALFDFEGGESVSSQTKRLLRELIRLRETQRLWQKAAAILTEPE